MKRVLVTGGTGLVGHALRKIRPRWTYVSSKDADLTFPDEAYEVVSWGGLPRGVETWDGIVHLAGLVGGVHANSSRQAEFFRQNVLINTNLLQAAWATGVRRVVSCLSTCIFPDRVEYPIRESSLHDGPPHPSNFGYAYAKRMLDVQSRAYNDQYGTRFFCVVPTNVYGPHDNFHPTDSHVIPGLIRRCHESKLAGTPFRVWGSGRPKRDFVFAEDLARAMAELLESYDELDPVSVASGQEISIRELAESIARHVGHPGPIEWDDSKPDGQFRKPVDRSSLERALPDFEFTELDEGIRQTVAWFRERWPNVRGA